MQTLLRCRGMISIPELIDSLLAVMEEMGS
jgi:hypothetical protein